MIHSAIWPEAEHLSGRTVTLIGNGSSGIQILPSILPKADKIFVMLRSRTWVTPALANRFAGENGGNKIFSDQEKEAWSNAPESYLAYRKEIENELNVRFRLYLKGSKAQNMGRDMVTKQMSDRLSAKPELIENMIPEFPVGYALAMSRHALANTTQVSATNARQRLSGGSLSPQGRDCLG